MSDIIERLRVIWGTQLGREAADLIEAQQRRIAELEAELAEWETRNQKDAQIIAERSRRATEETKKRLKVEAELTSLRAKIENAMVVAWQTWISGERANTFHIEQEAKTHFDSMNYKYPDDSRRLYSLIRKEDLL